MARITGTKQELLEAHMELQQFQQYQPTVAAMLGGRIETFYRQNEAKLQATHEKRKAIYGKYCQAAEDGKSFKEETYMKDVPNGDGTMKQVPEKRLALIEPVIELLPADKEKWQVDTRKAFEKELNDYLSQQTDWII